MRSPIPSGRQRISGRAWLEASSTCGGRFLVVVLNSDHAVADAVDVRLDAASRWVIRLFSNHPATYRVVSRLTRRSITYEAEFASDSGAEIELSFIPEKRGAAAGEHAVLVLDGLRIIPLQPCGQNE